LKNKEDRERLARIFEQGLGHVVGYVLPLRRRAKSNPGAYWASAPWFFRGGHLFLIPGDSPIGLRMPLDSLPWVEPADYPRIYEVDPQTELPPLPAQPSARTSGETETMPEKDEVVRTAVCVQPREGRWYLFMPPVQHAEDYLDLIAAIGDTAAELQMPVIIEGEPPPHDYRLDHIKVTPDPGVIEVNLHPAHNWDELVKNTTVLYEEARQSRLGTEKFLMDGRHVGTGGGNHIVIGGPTPAESPILRRPDLLRSLLCYWQNHPSLSFLFS